MMESIILSEFSSEVWPNSSEFDPDWQKRFQKDFNHENCLLVQDNKEVVFFFRDSFDVSDATRRRASNLAQIVQRDRWLSFSQTLQKIDPLRMIKTTDWF